jgi:alkaline phosphatase D
MRLPEPSVKSYDDHEVDNNWAGDISEENTPPELFLLRRAAAFQAWYEHMPVRRALTPRGPDILAYRRFTIGALISMNVLDTRLFRSDQPCGDGIKADCREALEPQRTMLGDPWCRVCGHVDLLRRRRFRDERLFQGVARSEPARQALQ